MFVIGMEGYLNNAWFNFCVGLWGFWAVVCRWNCLA